MFPSAFYPLAPWRSAGIESLTAGTAAAAPRSSGASAALRIHKLPELPTHVPHGPREGEKALSVPSQDLTLLSKAGQATSRPQRVAERAGDTAAAGGLRQQRVPVTAQE